MNIEELSLGSWVSFNGEPQKVFSLTTKNGMDFINKICALEVEPIPITKKILTDNGFDMWGTFNITDALAVSWSSFLNRVYVYDVNEWGEKEERYVMPCKYIHDLQRVLYMYGKDIESIL